jgi:hypothetical protein
MKKFFLTAALLMMNIFIFTDEMDLYQGKGYNDSGKTIDFKVTFDIQKKQVMLYINEDKFVYVLIYQNKDLLYAIDKTFEWDKVANDNKVRTLKKDMTEFKSTSGLFKQGKDWHTIFEIRSSFTFSRNDGRTSLLITANKFVATDNTNLITDYPNLYIPIDMLGEMKKSITDDVIGSKMDSYDNEKKKNDRLFK